uniref:Uncharacterized protein n=1 Tax=Anguilla anguilla TaxID=7936 RepID=A0A0E9SEE5_ANGAN
MLQYSYNCYQQLSLGYIIIAKIACCYPLRN